MISIILVQIYLEEGLWVNTLVAFSVGSLSLIIGCQ